MTRKRRVEQTPVIPEAALEALIGTTRTPEVLVDLFRAM